MALLTDIRNKQFKAPDLDSAVIMWIIPGGNLAENLNDKNNKYTHKRYCVLQISIHSSQMLWK